VRRNASGSNFWADRNALVCERGWRDGRSNEVDWRGGEDGPASEDDMGSSMRAAIGATAMPVIYVSMCKCMCK
jgi:hypothetical protein